MACTPCSNSAFGLAMLTGSVIQILNYSSWKGGVIYVSLVHCSFQFSSKVFDFRIMHFQALCMVGSSSLLGVLQLNVSKMV